MQEFNDVLIEQHKEAIRSYSEDTKKKQEQEIRDEIEKCTDELSEKAKENMIS